MDMRNMKASQWGQPVELKKLVWKFILSYPRGMNEKYIRLRIFQTCEEGGRCGAANGERVSVRCFNC